MGHQLVALLRSGIEADGIIHLILRGIGYLLVAAIDGGAAGIDEVLYFVVAACLQKVVETNQVALDIAIRISDTITHSCLGGKVHHHINLVFRKDLLDECLVCYAAFDECPILR